MSFLEYWLLAGGLTVLLALLPAHRFHAGLTKKKHPVLNILICFALPFFMLPAVCYVLLKNVQLYRSDQANPLSRDINDAITLLRKLAKTERSEEIVKQHAAVLAELTEMRANPAKFQQGAVLDEATDWLGQMEKRRQIVEELNTEAPTNK